jgi:hypothetical protein
MMNFKYKLVAITLFLLSNYSNAQTSAKYTKSPLDSPIDLSTWSLRIPEEDPEKYGKPMELSYPRILEYKTDELIKKYLYVDPLDKSLVFYVFPSGITSQSSVFSRTELRQKKLPGKNSPEVNWYFKDGIKTRGVFKIQEISEKKAGIYDETVFIQIYSKLSKEAMDAIGVVDGFTLVSLKVSWDNGFITIRRMELKDPNASDYDVASRNSWEEKEAFTFDEKVGFNKFFIDIAISNGKMLIYLNGKQSKLFQDVSVEKLNNFENYYRIGNYLMSKDPNAFCKVKLYYFK